MKSISKIEKFEDLTVWQRSIDLCQEIYRVTQQDPFAKDWALKNQIRKAAVSIPSNIAEGFERYSAQELKHFLNVAKGSAGEVRTQLTLARNLGYLLALDAEVLVKSCVEVSRMLAGYRKRVNRGK